MVKMVVMKVVDPGHVFELESIQLALFHCFLQTLDAGFVILNDVVVVVWK